MEKFDQDLRQSSEFAGWEGNGNYRYALEQDGKRYPVKAIVSLASNLPVSEFSGGTEANDFVRARGFSVVSLRQGDLQNAFEEILRNYPTARTTLPFGHDNEVKRLFDVCEQTLSSPEILGDRPVRVKVSIGQGNWAKVPWIALLDARETTTTQRGVYVVLLFRQDGSGVYATLNQGVTAPQRDLGPSAGREFVRGQATQIRARPEAVDLLRSGFQLDDRISLVADPGLGRDYEASTIAYKLYEPGKVPPDDAIIADLQTLLAAYDTYVTSKSSSAAKAKGAWIFQANPNIFDTRGAIRDHKELRWLVPQHADDMQVGDSVYLWESGPNAGIVGVARITGLPQVVADDPKLAAFVRNSDKFEGALLRATLAIERVIDPPLERQLIKADPLLAKMSIFQMAQGTNFSITDQQHHAIERLLGRDSSRNLCLIGTWKDAGNWSDQVRAAVEERGAWASPWSFPIKREAESLLKKPFYLYLNAGEGRVAIRVRVADYVTSQGNEGRQTPWPELTNSEWIGTTRSGPKDADIFKTWLKVDAIELLSPELHISDFEPAPGLSVQRSLLSAVTFGYAYLREEDYSMEALVAKTLLERSMLEEIVAALTLPVDAGGSPQIVLAGPPGTSKTWVAEAIASHISLNTRRVRLVQFHPNYSYEAFVEGLRPVAEGGAISFRQQHGALLSLVETMRAAGEAGPESPLYVLIVDEMNRANLPRVFGELMYLFEYREKVIRLQYSDEFALPPNLRFIGTMNTADRSIRSIDIALRRRFDVFELGPDAGVLRRFFEGRQLNVPNLLVGFEKLNARLDADLDRHHTIGHAFFMKPGIDRKMLRAIWDRKIYPLIEEYFFDQLDIARNEYVFETFWPA